MTKDKSPSHEEWTTKNKVELAAKRKAFGVALRIRRLKAGISQAELARTSGVSPKTLNNIEYGHAWPSLPFYFALCRILKMAKAPLS